MSKLLSNLRRGYIIGLRRARAKARAELCSMDAELEALRDDYHELAVKYHRQCYDRALDKAIMQRAAKAYNGASSCARRSAPGPRPGPDWQLLAKIGNARTGRRARHHGGAW